MKYDEHGILETYEEIPSDSNILINENIEYMSNPEDINFIGRFSKQELGREVRSFCYMVGTKIRRKIKYK